MLPYSPTMCGALEMRVHWNNVQAILCHHHHTATILLQWSVLSVRETSPPSLSVALEIFVLLVERGRVRAEWRSVWRGSGGLCVTVSGAKERHWWCASRVDLKKKVGMFFFLHCNLYNIPVVDPCGDAMMYTHMGELVILNCRSHILYWCLLW